MAQSNIYSVSADDVRELFGDYLEGPGACIVLVLSDRVLDDVARNAIERSLESFGYGAGACTYATLAPRNQEAEGGDIRLDPQALFLLVEGLDPLCVIIADAAAANSAATAYRMACDVDAPVRLFGRPAVAFRNLAAMLETDSGKQRAWKLLKSLPRR